MNRRATPVGSTPTPLRCVPYTGAPSRLANPQVMSTVNGRATARLASALADACS
ncbi:hypothetical protein [Azospirillum rugosum]|uniref:hypothetical protein n=1 Tax=Azospirillum rugosum TaxID=416170 RepID=UPI00361E0A41